MTMPYQELYALQNAREFMRDLLDPKKTPKVPKAIRHRAYCCLKHYPWEHKVQEVWGKVVDEHEHSVR